MRPPAPHLSGRQAFHSLADGPVLRSTSLCGASCETTHVGAHFVRLLREALRVLTYYLICMCNDAAGFTHAELKPTYASAIKQIEASYRSAICYFRDGLRDNLSFVETL